MGLVVIFDFLIAHLYFSLNKFFYVGICKYFICSSLDLIGNFGILIKAGFSCFPGKNSCLHEIINPSLPDLFFFFFTSLRKNRRNDFFFKGLIPYLEKNTFLIRILVYLCFCVIFICKFLLFLPE